MYVMDSLGTEDEMDIELYLIKFYQYGFNQTINTWNIFFINNLFIGACTRNVVHTQSYTQQLQIKRVILIHLTAVVF